MGDEVRAGGIDETNVEMISDIVVTGWMDVAVSEVEEGVPELLS